MSQLKTEKSIKDYATNKILAKYPNVYWYKPAGGLYGSSGAPDLELCVSGKYIAVEFKKLASKMDVKMEPKINRLSKLQQWCRKRILAAGGIYLIVDGESSLLHLEAVICEILKSTGVQQ